MPELLHGVELTPDRALENLLMQDFNFCELTQAVLHWKKADPSAEWTVEVCPGRGKDYFAVCKLSPRYPEASISCIALPEGSIRLVSANEAAKKAHGVVAHVSGDYDPSGELETFYAVSCQGQQPWKISSKVEFFETFSVVIKLPTDGSGGEAPRGCRAYIQLYSPENRWVSIAHVPQDRMWTLVKERLVVRGDRIRCIVYNDAGELMTNYSWDAVTTLSDFDEKPSDDDSFIAEAEEEEEEVADADEQDEKEEEVVKENKVVEEERSRSKSKGKKEKKNVQPINVSDSSEEEPARPARKRSRKETTQSQATNTDEGERCSPPPMCKAARKAMVAKRAPTPPPAVVETSEPVEQIPNVLPSVKSGRPFTVEEKEYLNRIKALLKTDGPSRLSTLGSKVKKPSTISKLVDFIRKAGEFDIQNSDIVSLKKS